MENRVQRVQLLDGAVQMFKRPRSPFWYAQTTVAGRQRKTSTKKETQKLAEDAAKVWYVGLIGKAAKGEISAERTFAPAAKKFMAEYETITQGQRSEKWVEGHRARIRLHLMPFFGETELPSISPGMIQDYRVHRIKVGTAARGGDFKKRKGLPDPTPAELRKIIEAAKAAGEERVVKPPSRSTLHDEVVTLNLVLKTAARHGWLKSLPDISAPYNAQTKIVRRPWFSPDEYKALYAASRENARDPGQPQFKWHAEQLHDFILFVGNTGLRPDEAWNLQHRDVSIITDHATGERILQIEVRGKRGVGYCKSMPGAVMPYERALNRPKPTRGTQKRNRSKKNPNPVLAPEYPERTDHVFPQTHAKMFRELLHAANLKFDRDGKPRTFYSLRHTYICLRLTEGADIYQVAKNCRTSVEMIEQHYAAHIANTINASAVNVMRPKAARAAERQANTASNAPRSGSLALGRPLRPVHKQKLRDAERVPADHQPVPGGLTAES